TFHDRENLRRRDPKNDADDSADGAERDRLDQELRKDVTAMRAHGHARADFARPLRHAYEHDVHDADATDYKRHASNRTKQSGHYIRGGRGRRGDFFLGADGEIVVAPFANIVTLPKQRDDLLLRGREIVGTGYLRVDVAQRRSSAEHAF